MNTSLEAPDSNPETEEQVETKPLNDFESVDNLSSDAGSDGDAFFEALDNDVNSMIIDDTTEVTHQEQDLNDQSDPIEATHSLQNDGSNTWENENNPYKKRYSDSSREAVKMRDELKNLEPFVPVLEAMKNDSGLVDHVRDYLVNGGQPAKSIQDQLNLGEDFMFDQQEAISNPESDSAKVMNAHVDSIVQRRVGQMIQSEQKRAVNNQRAQIRQTEESAFKEKHKMTEEDFETFKGRAKEHVMSLDDVNYLLNRDSAAKNTANATREDMRTQMKNVRNMPTSASGVNSQGQSKPGSEDDHVFDSMIGIDNQLDNLFG